MSRYEPTISDLRAAVFAVSNNKASFTPANDYDTPHAVVPAKTIEYFRGRLSFAVDRRDAAARIAYLLATAVDYKEHLSAPIALWVTEALPRVQAEVRHKVTGPNCLRLVEILALLAYHHRNTGLVVAQRDVVYLYEELYGATIPRASVKATFKKLAELSLIDFTNGTENGRASKVSLLTGRDYIGSSYGFRGTEAEAEFIAWAEEHRNVFEGLSQNRQARKAQKQAEMVAAGRISAPAVEPKAPVIEPSEAVVEVPADEVLEDVYLNHNTRVEFDRITSDIKPDTITFEELLASL